MPGNAVAAAGEEIAQDVAAERPEAEASGGRKENPWFTAENPGAVEAPERHDTLSRAIEVMQIAELQNADCRLQIADCRLK